MDAPEIMVLPDTAAIAREAAERVIAAAEEAIELTGSFSIGLAGGSTPKALYELLASDSYRGRIDWVKTEVYFGDERCVPPDHAESNYLMAYKALLSRVPIPGDNVYRMAGEIEPQQAAKEYGLRLKDRFADRGLDICLLGMGDDGHTASLFPHTPALAEKEHRVVAQFVERSTTGKSWRITLTAPFINRSGRVLFMVAGKNKSARLREVLEGPSDPDRLPSQLIDPTQTRVTWLLDAAAAGMDEDE
jgi:6-phosphogluconolactonase